MSQVEADALTAEVVAEYLKVHPDFFVERPELVDRLSFPHSDLGTVSLVHIQMNRQRQRIEELEEEITTLMSLAANNDRTFYEFMDLQGSILKCGDFKQVISAIELKAKDLGLRAYVRLFSQCDASTQLSKEHYSVLRPTTSMAKRLIWAACVKWIVKRCLAIWMCQKWVPVWYCRW